MVRAKEGRGKEREKRRKKAGNGGVADVDGVYF